MSVSQRFSFILHGLTALLFTLVFLNAADQPLPAGPTSSPASIPAPTAGSTGSVGEPSVSDAPVQIAALKQEINTLYAQMETLLELVEASQKKPARSAPALEPIELESIAASAEEPESEVYEQIADAGYLSDESWEAHDAAILAMSKKENRLFWQRMNKALESGDLEALEPVE